MQIEKRESLNIILNSTAFNLLSYLAVYMLFQFTTIIASRLFDIPTTLYYNKIGFNVIPEAWTFDAVKVIYSSGNIVLFLFSITFLVVIIKALEFNGLLRFVYYRCIQFRRLWNSVKLFLFSGYSKNAFFILRNSDPDRYRDGNGKSFFVFGKYLFQFFVP